MSLTKRQFIEAAFDEIGLASYVFDLQPEQLQAALLRLDGLIAQWHGKGIRISYPLPSAPDLSDIDAVTEVPDIANEAVWLNLALRLAPSYGKQASPHTMIAADQAFDALQARLAEIPQVKRRGDTPAGAGHKNQALENTYLSPSASTLEPGKDSEFDFS